MFLVRDEYSGRTETFFLVTEELAHFLLKVK